MNPLSDCNYEVSVGIYPQIWKRQFCRGWWAGYVSVYLGKEQHGVYLEIKLLLVFVYAGNQVHQLTQSSVLLLSLRVGNEKGKICGKGLERKYS